MYSDISPEKPLPREKGTGYRIYNDGYPYLFLLKGLSYR
jgi:hypothetical protein